MKLLGLFLLASITPAFASPVAPAMDAWGECTPEAALDDPETWASTSKGGRLAHTCLAPDTPPDRKIFEESYGYVLSPEEWSRALYLGMLARGEKPFVPIDPLPSNPVPLSGAWVFMLMPLGALVALKRKTT